MSSTAGFEHENYQHYSVDFSRIDALEKTLKRIATAFKDIDGLICCAGIGLFGQIEQLSAFEINNLMHVNFTSQAIVTKAFLPQMKAEKKGDLIYIGSVSGLQGDNQGSVYCASKFALRGFCQSIRKECAKSNVRCSLVEPGMCRTPFFDDLHFRPGYDFENALDPATVAQAICFILSLPSNTVVDELVLSPQKKVVCKSKLKLQTL